MKNSLEINVAIKNFIRREISDFESMEYAPTRKDSEKKCDLSLNINPYGVSKKVLSKLKYLDKTKISHYYPENTDLINEIASYIGVLPEQVMLGDGCDGCLEMITHTFIDRGDEAIIPIPTFHRYEFHTVLMGGKPVFVPMKNFELNSSDILNHTNNKSKIIFLSNPNNPTGIPIERNIKEEIINGFNEIVVVDEALADGTNLNGASLLNKYDNLIIVRSFSKTFGLASLRIGYIVSNPKIINQIKKTSSPFKVNGIAQELAIEALRDKQHIINSINYINENREFLISNLEKIKLKCTKSITTNFLVDVSNFYKNPEDLIGKLKEKNVLVTDAKSFRTQKNNYIRVAVATEEENEKFIEILSKLLGV